MKHGKQWIYEICYYSHGVCFVLWNEPKRAQELSYYRVIKTSGGFVIGDWRLDNIHLRIQWNESWDSVTCWVGVLWPGIIKWFNHLRINRNRCIYVPISKYMRHLIWKTYHSDEIVIGIRVFFKPPDDLWKTGVELHDPVEVLLVVLINSAWW